MALDTVKGMDKLPLAEQLAQQLVSKSQIAGKIMDEVHAGLKVHCSIPEGYAHCELGESILDIEKLTEQQIRDLLEHPPGTIVNPEPVHQQTMEFFRMLLEGNPLVCEGGDPMRPSVGAYLYGPPGVGKTHIMAAFGRNIETLLASRLSQLMGTVRSHIDIFLRLYEREVEHYKGSMADAGFVMNAQGIERRRTPAEKLQENLDSLWKTVAGSKDQPTDMLYLGFEQLCELYGSERTREEARHAVENARIVFVDDLHGKGDPSRLQVIQQLIERRYETGRFGTFMTTNIDIDHIGGQDADIAKRISSRSKESVVVFDFKDCRDWRETMKHRKIQLIRAEIDRRIAEKKPHEAS